MLDFNLYITVTLFILDSLKEANFIIITEKLKQKKFVIVEFLNEESAEVVSTNWITVNDISKTFYCQWPGSMNASKFAISRKSPLTNWYTYVCLPRKFYSK